MTQILIPTTDLLRSPAVRTVFNQLLDALVTADEIPTTGGGPSVISGGRTATYGGLIRIESERFTADPRGASWSKRLVTYTTPDDANTVVLRMLEEGREIFEITGLRGALGGTVTR